MDTTMTDNLDTWTSRIAWISLVAIVIGGSAWAGWMTIEINDKIPHSDMADLSSYSRDSAWIKNEISSLKENNKRLVTRIEGEFSRTIKANTEAIIQLKEQMKYNNKIWERVITKIEKE